jgi:hypothetical protein
VKGDLFTTTLPYVQGLEYARSTLQDKIKWCVLVYLLSIFQRQQSDSIIITSIIFNKVSSMGWRKLGSPNDDRDESKILLLEYYGVFNLWWEDWDLIQDRGDACCRKRERG